MGIENRYPIVPLSIDNLEDTRLKELIFDYENNVAYIKLENGTLFNISESEASLDFVKQYLEQHSEVILDVTVNLENGKTIKESISHIYELIQEFKNKKFEYAGSDTDGGSATSANKVNHSLIVEEPDESLVEFDGETDEVIDVSNLLKNTGGYVNGPMIAKKKFLLGENASYGFVLPTTGKEGQIFILLKEDL